MPQKPAKVPDVSAARIDTEEGMLAFLMDRAEAHHAQIAAVEFHRRLDAGESILRAGIEACLATLREIESDGCPLEPQ